MPLQLTQKKFCKLSKAKMKVLCIKARWIKACDKQKEIWDPDYLYVVACFDLITQLSVLFPGIGYRVVIVYFTTQQRTLPKKSAETRKKNPWGRNGAPKSTKTKRIKKWWYTKRLLHVCSFVKTCRDGRGFVQLASLLSFLVCVLFGTPFLHRFSFVMIFLSCKT